MAVAVIYGRVSTDERAESGLGLEAQVKACRDWCEANGQGEIGPFLDEGVTGTSEEHVRPALQAAFVKMRELGKGTIFLVAKRDRMGRDPIVVASIESRVKRLRGRVVSAAGEGTGADDVASVAMRGMVDLFAQYELGMIRGRTRSALEAKRRRGERTGGVPYGWVPDEEGPRHGRSGLPLRLKPDPVEQERRRLIFALADAGSTTGAVARRLNADGVPTKTGKGPWRRTAVARILESREGGRP